MPQQGRYESLFLAPPQSMAPSEDDLAEFEPKSTSDRPRARSGRPSGHRARR